MQRKFISCIIFCQYSSSYLDISISEHLCEYFAKFGNVESATVKFDKSGRSKGFGFVLFEDRESTDQVKQDKLVKRFDIFFYSLGLFSRFTCNSRQACRYQISTSSRSSTRSESICWWFRYGSIGW